MCNSELKLGMIGLDTSHCEAFTKLINNSEDEFHISGAKIVEAYSGGSSAFSFSIGRVKEITERMKNDLNIKIVDKIEELSKDLDGFFLESVDGRQHLEQFKILADFGKPIFIDKPFACSFDDAKEIVRIAKGKNIPIMTASAIRYGAGISNLNSTKEKILACDVVGPMNLLDDYPGYFWYGIHSVEVLYSYMGEGCESVQVNKTDDSDIVICKWKDGRRCVVRGSRSGCYTFSATIYTEANIKFAIAEPKPPYYALMLKEIIPFFQTGKSPIDISESLEIVRFLEAMNESSKNSGKEIIL